ncbi:MAG: hypothetical protein UU47_C0002G0063 [candidate division TM6 bacterium GW2011_GWE2_41_16]|nr:MAG: hypothetical protein UU47_C0002G0063 [candidate division TM6 bacterium GW2011_GWE2_41_16]
MWLWRREQRLTKRLWLRDCAIKSLVVTATTLLVFFVWMLLYSRREVLEISNLQSEKPLVMFGFGSPKNLGSSKNFGATKSRHHASAHKNKREQQGATFKHGLSCAKKVAYEPQIVHQRVGRVKHAAASVQKTSIVPVTIARSKEPMRTEHKRVAPKHAKITNKQIEPVAEKIQQKKNQSVSQPQVVEPVEAKKEIRPVVEHKQIVQPPIKKEIPITPVVNEPAPDAEFHEEERIKNPELIDDASQRTEKGLQNFVDDSNGEFMVGGDDAGSTGEDDAFAGYDEDTALVLSEIAHQWKPPVALSRKGKKVRIEVLFDHKGTINHAIFVEKTGVVAYDYAARMAVIKAFAGAYPKAMSGRMCVFVF